ncbi:hypothetical protein KPL55_23925, partial [Clostridium lacusfryxellense]|uniref:hypothetical protein n=1 Tax=Clostridium lacusfryxellense TaxID=205328 RepID=UPI001C0B7044
NTKVKLQCADGTAGVTLWKSRLSPGNKKNTKFILVFFILRKYLIDNIKSTFYYIGERFANKCFKRKKKYITYNALEQALELLIIF